MEVFKVTYTLDKGDTFRQINVIAENVTCAYINLGLKIPDADITEIESMDKIVTIKVKNRYERT